MTQGYGAPGGYPPGRPRRARHRRVLVVLGAAAGLAVVAALVAGGIMARGSGQPASRATSVPAAASPGQAMPPQMFAQTLFARLTSDLQASNEAGFLSLVAPPARPSVQSWWANQQALGFTSGVIMPADVTGALGVDPDGNGSLDILAGTHSRLDPTGGDGLPAIPCTHYQVGIHFASPDATGEITSWHPEDDAPWDQGTRLYVRTAGQVEVAGYPSDKALVNATLPLAQAAAGYDLALFRRLGPAALHQAGFVVFVSSQAAVRNAWFRSGPQPKGWSGDEYGGVTFPLAGAEGSHAGGISQQVSDGAVGGARVIIVPYQQAGETAHEEEAVLVHEFVHDLLALDNTGLYGTVTPVPAWAEEGIAVAVQDLYLADPDPAPPAYQFGVLNSALASLPASYRNGRLPSTQQIYDQSLATGRDWYQIAGSVYEYIATRYGMSQMLASAALLNSHDASPFGNVSAGPGVFYPPSTVLGGWRSWLANT
jgi:hypothetical protein